MPVGAPCLDIKVSEVSTDSSAVASKDDAG